MDTKLVKISLENGLIKLHGVLSNILTKNKTYTTILVCAADDLRKFRKIRKVINFRKIIKKLS